MKKQISVALLALLFPTSLSAATMTISTSADGWTQTFGGNSVNTSGSSINVQQSGGLIQNGIFEFSLAGIDDGATINSVSFEWTNTRFVSNTPSNPGANVDLFAYLGDGSVTIDDHAATGDQVADTSVPKGGSAGDVTTIAFTDLTMFASALLGDLLTVRFETDSFASFRIAALESLDYDAARLVVDYTPGSVSAVPLPASGLLLLGALGGVAGLRFRKKT
ncbi:VPLPA-CTERM sorting domain-containing protein [Roseibium aggregatum]|uniref:VPLPA-CTERM sorting domain-containing protein n=1 Tax=Roseibium aggregatum TaxID=187304 RepID=A0A939EA67_9HYPH|nr:VPLPA-CTERM sorting domain-containing protein [Roseibium aggregatum]MBN9669183.1 VPLPA-CTERM sorting domain-containing protein [Roseibium aggregatum]